MLLRRILSALDEGNSYAGENGRQITIDNDNMNVGRKNKFKIRYMYEGVENGRV